MNNTPGSLRLPMQVAPIDRTPSGAALSGSGVEASQDIGQQLLGLAGQALPGLLTSLFSAF